MQTMTACKQYTRFKHKSSPCPDPPPPVDIRRHTPDARACDKTPKYRCETQIARRKSRDDDDTRPDQDARLRARTNARDQKSDRPQGLARARERGPRVCRGGGGGSAERKGQGGGKGSRENARARSRGRRESRRGALEARWGGRICPGRERARNGTRGLRRAPKRPNPPRAQCARGARLQKEDIEIARASTTTTHVRSGTLACARAQTSGIKNPIGRKGSRARAREVRECAEGGWGGSAERRGSLAHHLRAARSGSTGG